MIECYDNIIDKNNATGEFGLYLPECANNTFKSNHVSSFGLVGSMLSHFMNDIDTSNTINGKPILYLINQSNLEINPFTCPSIGYLGIVNSKAITLRRLTMTGMIQGLLLAQVSNSEIVEVDLSNNQIGFSLWNCSVNTFMGCTITRNGVGVGMVACVNNTFRGNIIASNTIGMSLTQSNNNTFHRNNFIDNIQ